MYRFRYSHDVKVLVSVIHWKKMDFFSWYIVENVAAQIEVASYIYIYIYMYIIPHVQTLYASMYDIVLLFISPYKSMNVDIHIGRSKEVTYVNTHFTFFSMIYIYMSVIKNRCYGRWYWASYAHSNPNAEWIFSSGTPSSLGRPRHGWKSNVAYFWYIYIVSLYRLYIYIYIYIIFKHKYKAIYIFLYLILPYSIDMYDHRCAWKWNPFFWNYIMFHTDR